MEKRSPRHRAATLLALVSIALLVSSCAFFGADGGSKPAVPFSIAYDAATPVTRLSADQGKLRVTVTGLAGENVYLVKCNGSIYDALVGTTGMIDGYSVSRSVARSANGPAPESFAIREGNSPVGLSSSGKVTRREHALAANFSRGDASQSRGAVSDTVADQLAKPPAGYIPYTLSDVGTKKKTFYVEDSAQRWKASIATLRGFGAHCLVWVADDNYDIEDGKGQRITPANVADIVANFDKIYYPETALLGYEYGAGVSPSDPAYGGADGETRVNIVVYDIDYDAFSTQDSGIVGYFWAKDLFPQDTPPATLVGTQSSNYNLISNLGEIFYIDAHFLNSYAGIAYSTLAHEFQHMINFNQKNVRWNIGNAVPTWYNEMLSLLVEDALAPVIGIDITNEAHPAARLDIFNAVYYGSGLTYWPSADQAIYSYPYAYAFGAYLARNYGGARLLEEMLANDSVGVDSVSEALAAVGSSAGFPTAFQKFGEALIFSASVPSTVNTFNRSPAPYSLPLPDSTNWSYSFDAFDLWNVSTTIDGGAKSPVILRSKSYAIKAYGVLAESVNDLQSVVGSVSFDVIPPTDPDVSMYVMIR